MTYYTKNHFFLLKNLYKLALAKTDYIICVSDFVRVSLINFLNLTTSAKPVHNYANKQLIPHTPVIHTIYNIITNPPPNVLSINKQLHRSLYGIKESTIVFMSIGRLVPDKGFDILIRAYFTIANQIDSILIIYGDGEEKYKLELLSLIKQLQLSDKVKLMGHTNEPFVALQSCDIFISSSLTEALSFVVIEALSCKKAVIVSNTGASEIVEHGQYGEVVAIGNIEQLAEKMLYMAQSQSVREQYANKAHLALAKFDNNKSIRQWQSVLNG